MDIRLIASDVDGTILPRGGVISERTIAAVHACKARGIDYVIASGRWYVSAKVIADALRLTEGVMIIANGGAVVDIAGNILREWVMPRPQAERAYRLLRQAPVMVNAFVRNAVYRVNTRAYHTPPKGLGDYLGGEYRMVNDDVSQFERFGLEDVYKLEAYGDDPETLARLKGELEREGYSVTSAYHTNIEIMGLESGKGTALRWLLQERGLSREQCAAFGDNLNDQTLLEAAGCAVAMGNAIPQLKRVASLVARDCEQDGEAEILEAIAESKEIIHAAHRIV